jgi:predicted RNase H-like HicB family nuclease
VGNRSLSLGRKKSNSRRRAWLDRPLRQFEDLLMAALNSCTAIYKQDGDFWIGSIEEVPGVNARKKTKKELLASLKVFLREALEFNREDAQKAAETGYIEEPLML